MAFDKSLDKELFADTVEFESTRLNIGVYSYNEGQPKLQIARENMNSNGEWNFAKAGRMTKEEVEKIIPVMQRALDKMEPSSEEN